MVPTGLSFWVGLAHGKTPFRNGLYFFSPLAHVLFTFVKFSTWPVGNACPLAPGGDCESLSSCFGVHGAGWQKGSLHRGSDRAPSQLLLGLFSYHRVTVRVLDFLRGSGLCLRLLSWAPGSGTGPDTGTCKLRLWNELAGKSRVKATEAPLSLDVEHLGFMPWAPPLHAILTCCK